MKWYPKPEPQVGSTRLTRKFAWFPHKLSDGAKIWLESYIIEELRISWTEYDSMDCEYSVYGWETVSERSP